MPETPRFLAGKGLPIETAVTAPSSLAAQSSSFAGVLKGAGAIIGEMGEQELKVQAELTKRNNAAIDANSKASAFSFYKLAGEKFKAIQEATPTEEWEEKFNKFYSEADGLTADLSMSEGARKSVQSQAELSKFVESQRMSIQATAFNTRRAVVSTGVMYESSIVDGGDIEEAGEVHKEALISLLGQEKGEEAFLKKTDEALKIRKKKDFNTALGEAFNSWSLTRDLNTSFDLIAADPRIPEEDKQEAESEIRTRAKNREAEEKLETEQVVKQADEDIKGRLNNGQFDGIKDFINNQEIPESVKHEQIKTANSYIESVKKTNAKPDFVTTDDTNVKIDRIVRAVRSGKLSYKDAIEDYKELSGDVKATEGSTNLNNISKASEQSKSADDRRKNADLTTRTRQLRDSIQRQTSMLFEPSETDELLRDLANTAELELSDKFDGIEYEKDDLVAEVDRLKRKYTMTEPQIARAVAARKLQLAESFEEQQAAITESIRQLNEEGNREEAKRVMEEAISLGFDLSSSGKAKPKQKKVQKSGLKRVFNAINPFD